MVNNMDNNEYINTDVLQEVLRRFVCRREYIESIRNASEQIIICCNNGLHKNIDAVLKELADKLRKAAFSEGWKSCLKRARSNNG